MPLTWRTLLTHWKAYSTALGQRNNVAPYVEDFTIVRSRCFESLPLMWRTLQPLWEAYSVSRHIGPERQTCPLHGGLCDHFGRLIPVFHNHMVGTEIVRCLSVRGLIGVLHTAKRPQEVVQENHGRNFPTCQKRATYETTTTTTNVVVSVRAGPRRY